MANAQTVSIIMIRHSINGTPVGRMQYAPTRGHPKRGAFCTSYLVATPKRGAYSYSQVGAYCIRPIRRHPTDGECANRANYHDSSFHKWNARRAYAIRPYIRTTKRAAFSYSRIGAGRIFLRYPDNLAGIPDALIFFCLLFFHQGKKRR